MFSLSVNWRGFQFVLNSVMKPSNYVCYTLQNIILLWLTQVCHRHTNPVKGIFAVIYTFSVKSKRRQKLLIFFFSFPVISSSVICNDIGVFVSAVLFFEGRQEAMLSKLLFTQIHFCLTVVEGKKTRNGWQRTLRAENQH